MACLLSLITSYACAVDDARLLAAHTDDANWLTYGHGYTNQRYSGLDQIDTANARRLVVKWIYQTGVLGTFPTSPIVADGHMYLSTPYNHVDAIDAASGRRLWRYTHEMATATLCCGAHNRGLAIGYGRLYMITADARLIALHAATGAVVWDVPVVDPMTGQAADLARIKALDPADPDNFVSLTRFAGNMAPAVYDGKVFVGVSGTGYSAILDEAEAGNASVLGRPGTRRGLRAFLSAYDAASGRLVWRWYSTAASGWEGEFAATTAFGDVLDRDLAAERAQAAKYREAWKVGGGSIYSSPSIDPELGLIYFGTGNASPTTSARATTCIPRHSLPSTCTRAGCGGITNSCRTTSGAMTSPHRRCCSTSTRTVNAYGWLLKRANPAGCKCSTVRAARRCAVHSRSCHNARCFAGPRASRPCSPPVRVVGPIGRRFPTARKPAGCTYQPPTIPPVITSNQMTPVSRLGC